MKLLNYTSAYFAGILLLIITLWAGMFYYSMLDEIYDSIDDGLANQKLLVIKKATSDSTVLSRREFEEGYYTIKEIPFSKAQHYKDTYQDTLLYMEYEEDYEPVRLLKTAFRQGGNYYEMQVITSMVEEDDLIADLFFSLLWLYLGLVASILILNNVLLRKLWQPFYRLLDNLQKFRLDKDETIKPAETRIEEFKLLNETVSRLLNRSLETYNSQKQFIENASHELQTPLAISLNKLELLAGTADLTEEQSGLLAGAISNLERLKRLNKSLSLLTRIENRQFPEASEVEINAEVKNLLADFSEQAAHRNIFLNLTETGTCTVFMNPGLAGILLTNLLKNALVHNHSGGFVNVVISPGSLEIQNSGAPEPLPEKTIFGRFYKGGQSANNTGLGLSIAKAIAGLYGFQVTYHFEDTHIFRVNFRPA